MRGNRWISTTFLGLAASGGAQLWESCLFPERVVLARYASRAEAEAGHSRLCAEHLAEDV